MLERGHGLNPAEDSGLWFTRKETGATSAENRTYPKAKLADKLWTSVSKLRVARWTSRTCLIDVPYL
jgi:hypothetical protein